jgi:IS5 family transposase
MSGGVGRKALEGGRRKPREARASRRIVMVRAGVEHSFRVIKRQFGQVKTRYRGLAKNRARMFARNALSNLFRVRRSLDA